MSTINRTFFYDYARGHLFDGRLRQAQVDGMGAILDYWERNLARSDDRWLAYCLGTTHHETDRRMQPIEEYGRGAHRTYGRVDPQTGKAYYGRGFVQLTWRRNYQKMGDELGVDLVRKPERALELGIATRILFVGMTNGFFTTKRLSDYFNRTTADWVNARRIINGTERAQLVAGYARHYYAAISYTT